MVREELQSFLADLSAFYERKQEPGQRTFDLWFDKVKSIPGECLKWITNKIQEEQERFPNNITATVWSLYHQWLEANPEKKAHATYFECPDCHEGLIFATKKKNDVKYRYVFGCSKCKQNHSRAYEVMSRHELIGMGYEPEKIVS